jgi:hypothetical protein
MHTSAELAGRLNRRFSLPATEGGGFFKRPPPPPRAQAMLAHEGLGGASKKQSFLATVRYLCLIVYYKIST